MLTGRRTFEGKTQTNVAAAILERDAPAVDAIAPHVPPAIAHVVSRCLEKDRDARWQTASDVKRELQWAARQRDASSAALNAAAPTTPAAARSWWRDPRSLGALALAALAVAAIVGVVFTPASPNPSQDTVSLSITLPEALSDVQPPNNTWMPNIALSPDDGWAAFSGLRGSTPALFLRRVASFDLREVPGGGIHPFFSADSRALAFLREREVWRTPVETLAPVRVGLLPAAEWNIQAALWHPHGHFLFASERGIYRMADRGGEVTFAVKSDTASRQIFRELSLLGDGRVLARTTNPAGDHLVVIDPSTWQVTALPGQTGGRLANGWLFRSSVDGLVAVRFDERQLAAVGEPIALDGAAGSNVNVLGVPTVSRGGSVAWFVVPIVPRGPVYVDRTGRVSPLPFSPKEAVVRWPRMSPSGRRLAYGFMTSGEVVGSQVPLQFLESHERRVGCGAQARRGRTCLVPGRVRRRVVGGDVPESWPPSTTSRRAQVRGARGADGL